MIQHFIKEPAAPLFRSETEPRLYYLGEITPEISLHPRILHSHADHVEISIIYSGESEYLIRDKKQFIQRGDILIYNSGVVHDELSGAHAQIGSYFFAIGNLRLPGLRENALIPDGASPVFHAARDFDRLLQLCRTMIDGAEDTGEWGQCITHFSMLALLEIIWRVVYGESTPRETGQIFCAGMQIKGYIDRHFREPLTLRTISEALRLSESYVSHTFKDMLGYTPMQYVLRRKIGEAQTLLISTDDPITEIARMVGYDSQSHFNQRFKQYVGISPGAFRRNYKTCGGPGEAPVSPPSEPQVQES